MTGCRSCGSTEVLPFLDLGNLPLADGLLRAEELGQPEPRFPLSVAFCQRCSLVQLLDAVPPERLFGAGYLYFSSYSDTLVEHARAHAERLIETRGLGPGSLVVEIASNDGYLLSHFVRRGIPVLGIDPAPAQAAAAEAAGVPTLRAFFGADLAARLRAEGRRADVVIANNAMAHTPDPNGFAEGLRLLLAEDGVATIENQYVGDLVTQGAFDTIYHEHFSYFSCTAVDRLLRRHGLYVNRVERFPLQGGTLRWTAEARDAPDASVGELLRRETEQGLTAPAFYEGFAGRVVEVKAALLELLVRLRSRGERVVAYGAAAKGTILLNVCGIGLDLVEVVVDRNPHKRGLYVPGVRIPIRDPSLLLDELPEYVLLLAWNLEEEVLCQQEEYRRRGGRFVVPFPQPRIV